MTLVFSFRLCSSCNLIHHERAEVEDLEVFVGAVKKSALVDGKLLADERLLAIGHGVAHDDSVVNLKIIKIIGLT